VLNINRAGIKELKEIKGIGPTIAVNIINYREKAGRFSSLEDLIHVKGIGDRKLAALRKHLNARTTPEKGNLQGVKIEFDPSNYGLDGLGEVHLVGTMNDWDSEDKSYPLIKDETGIWSNRFDLKPGDEYKIMYDSTSWEEGLYIGDGSKNFVLKEE